MAAKKAANKKKSGNKHQSNVDRSERKYKRSKSTPVAGKCGSRFCSRATGCDPWK